MKYLFEPINAYLRFVSACCGLIKGIRTVVSEYEKYFFGDFLSADFLAKTLRVNKIAMKSFSKNLSFGVDFKL